MISVSKYIQAQDENKTVRHTNPIYIYEMTDKLGYKLISASLTTPIENDCISITNDIKAIDQDKKINKISTYTYINPANFYQINKALDKALKWLVDNEYEKLYSRDNNNKVIGITDDKILELVKMKYNKYLLFKPAVTFDKDGNSYQGIQLKCDGGILGDMNGEEFLIFYTYMKELLNNFYSLSLQLFNSCITALNNTTTKTVTEWDRN
jgi:hypothetical protein